jgi:hypothetical protein
MPSNDDTTTQTARLSPVYLMFRDIAILAKNLYYTPGIVLPFFTKDEGAELYLAPSGVFDILSQLLLALIGIISVVVVPVLLLILPGWIALLLATAAYGIIWVLAIDFQGPRIIFPNMDQDTRAKASMRDGYLSME